MKLDGTTLGRRVDGQFGSICNDVAVRSLGKAFAAEGIRISAVLLAMFLLPMPRPHAQWAVTAVCAAGSWRLL